MVKIAGLVTLILDIILVLTTVFLMLSARKAVEGGNKVIYKVRKPYATLLILALVAIFAYTITKMPYRAMALTTPAATVNVTGHMWYWQMEQEGAPALGALPKGEVIEFAVTAADVNHGFGVFDPDGKIVGQTQAMPGYTNHVRMVLEKPGLYHVLCMEYCGLVHQAMIGFLTVE